MNKILAYIGYTILLINFICFLKSLSRNGRAFFVFTIYLGTIIIINLFAGILNFLKYQNLILSHFYFIFQFILLSLFYKEIFINKTQKQIVKINLILVLFYLLVTYYLNTDLLGKFNLFEIFVTSISLCIYVVINYYNMLSNRKQFHLINAGLLIYLFGSTFLFFFMDLSQTYKLKWHSLLYPLNSILYIIYQIFIFIEWKTNYSKS